MASSKSHEVLTGNCCKTAVGNIIQAVEDISSFMFPHGVEYPGTVDKVKLSLFIPGEPASR